jgi:hypothetical protein
VRYLVAFLAALAVICGVTVGVYRLDVRSHERFIQRCVDKGGHIEIAVSGRHKVRWCSDSDGRMI